MDPSVEAVRAADADIVRNILTGLQESIGPQRFNAWFRHGASLSIEDGHVKLSVPNPFVANWIDTHYQSELVAVVAEQSGKAMPVIITVDPSLTGTIRRSDLDRQAEMVAKATTGRSRPRRPLQPVGLRYKLKDFVVGQSNKLAYSAALAVTGQAQAPFGHLFVHGPCGVGKTHLLQAICNELPSMRRGGKPVACRYVTAEQFTNEFISALRAKRVDKFRALYRKLGLLAIDDVHFLAAKKATQDEFLHTFNAIESAGNQIVMASDARPRLVGQLNPQLVSRFVAGMVVRIDLPDRAVRMEILRRRARKLKLKVATEVLEYVAMQIRGSVRELEGALIKLAALAALDGGSISLSIATAALADHLARTDSAITLGDIEAVVATFFGVTPADIHSTRRTRTVCVARMVAMFLARRHTPMSFPEIGRFMGKNHSSVVLAIQRMEKLLASKAELTWTTPTGPKSVAAEGLVTLLTEQFT